MPVFAVTCDKEVWAIYNSHQKAQSCVEELVYQKEELKDRLEIIQFAVL